MSIPMERLVVVNFPQRGKDSMPAETECRRKGLFIADTCSRLVLITTQDTWNTEVPEAIKSRARTREQVNHSQDNNVFERKDAPCFHMESGEAAYALLLRIAVGLESTKKAEQQIHAQITEDWKKYQRVHPLKAKQLEAVVTPVLGDAKRIHGSVIQGRTAPTFEEAAHRLAGIDHTAAVVIVGSGSRQDTDLAHQLGKQNKQSAAEIVMLMRDEQAVATVRQRMELMAEKSEIVVPWAVATLSQENMEYAQLANAVFVVTHNSVIDRTQLSGDVPIILLDTDRKNNDARAWEQHASNTGARVILPGTIRTQLEKDEKDFAALLTQTEHAITNSIYSHKRGKTPAADILGLPPAQYQQGFDKIRTRFTPPSLHAY